MKKPKVYHFSGYATKNDVLCSDGRVIRHNAFQNCDGIKVPLIWNHEHREPWSVLGHAYLENRDDGVYTYGVFNDTEQGQNALEYVRHGDLNSLSIFANRLKQNGKDVIHGIIREVSLVLCGANSEATIDAVLVHSGEEDEVEATMTFGSMFDFIAHSEDDEEEDLDEDDEDDLDDEDDEDEEEPMKTTPKKKTTEVAHADKEKTGQDIFDTLNEEQKTLFYALAGQLAGEDEEDTEDTEDEEDTDMEDEEEAPMRHNAFNTKETTEENTLSHSQMTAIITDAQKRGSLKAAFQDAGFSDLELKHSETPAPWGIENVNYLFPDPRNITNAPSFIQRDMSWVTEVFGATRKSPFSRIRTIFADITADEARAKGYVKGNEKLEEFFSLVRRTTDPQTVYKKQKMHRDDRIDITDFDVIAWLKMEMRMMLEEEISRAILIGDGRLGSAEDKISETHIRSIWNDEALYTIRADVTLAANASDNDAAKAMIRAAIKAREDYTGSGSPTLFTTEGDLTNMLLTEDTTGRMIYDSVEKLATVLRVKKIVTVPAMKNQSYTREAPDGRLAKLMGIIVNMADYNVGADKGGAVTMFEDFDIDFNQEKYLIETRVSGALIRPKSAIALERVVPQ